MMMVFLSGDIFFLKFMSCLGCDLMSTKIKCHLFKVSIDFFCFAFVKIKNLIKSYKIQKMGLKRFKILLKKENF